MKMFGIMGADPFDWCFIKGSVHAESQPGDCTQHATKQVDCGNPMKTIQQMPSTKEFSWPVSSKATFENSKNDLGDFWEYLDNDLKPAKAIPSCPQSQKIYENHKEMAHDMLVVQEKIFYLNQNKKQLMDILRKQDMNHKSSKERYHNTISDLEKTTQNLRHRQHELRRDLEQVKARKRQNEISSKQSSSYGRGQYTPHPPQASSHVYSRYPSSHGHTSYCQCYENPNRSKSPNSPPHREYPNNQATGPSSGHAPHCFHNHYRH